MPKKTEILEQNQDEKEIAKATKKTGTTRKSTTKKASTTSKTTAKKTTKASTAKKTTTKKSTKTKATAETKTTTRKRSTAKTTRTKKATLPNDEALENKTTVEYYDLPYRYNQTVVKILYQTPTTLFIYWDISDADRANFVEKYGNNFFNDTKPVLVIHNDTLHYSFEIDINDFANSWYLHVNDSNCKYTVELGRRPKPFINELHFDNPNNYLYIAQSNEIESPNDHVLFSKNMDTVYFKDVKTNIVSAESITSLSFMRNMGKIYSLYDLQSKFVSNPHLNNPGSSTFSKGEFYETES